MKWKDCIDEGVIKKTRPNENLSKSTKNIALLRLELWQKVKSRRYIPLKLEAYYEIIKELLFSHMYEQGYNSSNHICLIAFAIEMSLLSVREARLINQLRIYRHRINYQGKVTSDEYFLKNKETFLKIIKKLSKTNQNLYKQKF